MDFRWRFIGWKQTWACCFWPSSFITHHLLHAYTEINKKKNLKSTHTAILQINKELTKKEPHSSLIIDVLAKLTRQVRNPGYNLWDKYFIANICLYILCQCVLKLLQMNVKRKVSEQAVEGMEQRCSSAGRREEDSRGEKTQQQTIFLGSSNKLNMQFGGLYSIALAQRKTKKWEKESGAGVVIRGVELAPSCARPPPPLLGPRHGLDSTHILPQLIPGLSQLSANRQPHKKSSQI